MSLLNIHIGNVNVFAGENVC